jgi:peptidoglycan/LPS O-acetylase OafA/YrhL
LRPQLNVLTSLRFFAAALVVLFHVQVSGTVVAGPWWYRNFAGIGFIGVNCFFVLSGFILVYTYAGKPVSAWRFWQARFARVYPAYLFSLLVTAPLFFYVMRVLHLPLFAWSEQHLPAAVVLTLGLLQAWVPQAALTWNPVCWSLSAEAFFYLVFPGLLPWGARLNTGGLVAGLTGCALFSLSLSVLYIVLHPDGADMIDSPANDLFWKNVLSFNPALRLPEFLTGVLAGYLFIEGKVTRRWGGRLVAAGLLVLVVLVLFADRIPKPLVSAGFLSPAFAAVIFGLALRPRWVTALEGRWLVLLGEASYSLYLLHSNVISVAFNVFPNWPVSLRLTFALLACLLAALLCYSLIEQPARRLLRPASRGRPQLPPQLPSQQSEHAADQPQVGDSDQAKQAPGDALHRY